MRFIIVLSVCWIMSFQGWAGEVAYTQDDPKVEAMRLRQIEALEEKESSLGLSDAEIIILSYLRKGACFWHAKLEAMKRTSQEMTEKETRALEAFQISYSPFYVYLVLKHSDKNKYSDLEKTQMLIYENGGTDELSKIAAKNLNPRNFPTEEECQKLDSFLERITLGSPDQ